MKKYPPEIKQAAIEMYAEGMRVDDISEIVGASTTTVSDWGKQAGIHRDKLYRRKDEPPIAESEWVEHFKAEWNEVRKLLGYC